MKLILWKGHCEVHERFTGAELRAYRDADPSIQIIAHPECPPDVIAEADFTGSTAHMIDWVKTRQPRRVVMVTECSMADNVAAEAPNVEFVRPCNLCPHMKRITLPKIRHSLETMTAEVVIDPASRSDARRSVDRMLAIVGKWRVSKADRGGRSAALDRSMRARRPGPARAPRRSGGLPRSSYGAGVAGLSAALTLARRVG